MKFVKSILPVLCILVGVSVASPIAAPEPVPSTATENYPGDGSPAAWALLSEYIIQNIVSNNYHQ